MTGTGSWYCSGNMNGNFIGLQIPALTNTSSNLQLIKIIAISKLVLDHPGFFYL